MDNWNLADHGDGREQRLWPLLATEIPAYETFWKLYVVPQTFRIRDREIKYVRPSARWPELADYNYAAFSHVGGTKKVLEQDERLEESESIYAFASRLYSATEATQALVKESTKVMGKYGGAEIPRVERWFDVGKATDAWSTFLDVEERIGEYRNPHVHQVEIVRVGNKLPKREYLAGYKNLSALASAIASPEIVAEQFAPTVEILTGLYDDLVEAMNAVWVFLAEQFASLPEHARLLEELSTVSDEDDEVLAKMAHPIRDAQGVEIQESGILRRPRGGGSSALSAQGPEDLSDDWPYELRSEG